MDIIHFFKEALLTFLVTRALFIYMSCNYHPALFVCVFCIGHLMLVVQIFLVVKFCISPVIWLLKKIKGTNWEHIRSQWEWSHAGHLYWDGLGNASGMKGCHILWVMRMRIINLQRGRRAGFQRHKNESEEMMQQAGPLWQHFTAVSQNGTELFPWPHQGMLLTRWRMMSWWWCSFILQKLYSTYSRYMRPVIAMHQEKPRTHCTSIRSDGGSKDFIPIPTVMPVRVPLTSLWRSVCHSMDIPLKTITDSPPNCWTMLQAA